MRVCKFGGAPLADGAAIRKMERILKREPERRVLVPSAPGKRDGRDEKITDLLYACQAAAAAGRNFGHLFDRVAERYREIAHALGLPPPDSDLRAVYAGLKDGRDAAWAASRGEWLCGRLLARYLDWPFVDAAEVIRFDTAGRLKFQETMELLRHRLRGGGVLPGFYGAEENGAIHTFARGGSDITGALAAAALNADVYENFKDVAGVFAADPAIVPGARCVADMTYRELRALSRLGAQVISEAAVAPVRAAGVPLNIRPADDPSHPGTWVHAAFGGDVPRVTGVTGRGGLTLWRLEGIEKGPEMARAALNSDLPLERLALDAGLKVILCVGENLQEREAGKHFEVVTEQTKAVLYNFTAQEMASVVIAYEPVWAIGTGKTASAEQAQEIHACIRSVIEEKFGPDVAQDMTILYGGSCKPSNAKELFAQKDIDGGLIGGAALKAEDFLGIAAAF